MTDLSEGARLALMNWPGDGRQPWRMGQIFAHATVIKLMFDAGLTAKVPPLSDGWRRFILTPAGIAKRAELLKEMQS